MARSAWSGREARERGNPATRSGNVGRGSDTVIRGFADRARSSAGRGDDSAGRGFADPARGAAGPSRGSAGPPGGSAGRDDGSEGPGVAGFGRGTETTAPGSAGRSSTHASAGPGPAGHGSAGRGPELRDPGPDNPGHGARHGSPHGGGGRSGGRRSTDQELGGPGADWPTPEDLAASVLAAVVGRVLGGGGRRRGVGALGLLRAGLAGGAAAMLVDLLRPLLYGRSQEVRIEGEIGDRVMAGAAQGLVYGAVVEPHFPGPSLVKGALFGSAEYATETSGGLGHLMRAHTPHGKIPGVGDLVERLRPKDRAYLEHVVFGIALALLYGSSRSRRGIRIEGEAEE